MAETTLKQLTALLRQFVNERDWKQFHNPKDMAVSLMLESAEVLELTQWKNGDELEKAMLERREALSDELSDVLFWVLEIADHYQIDLAEAFAAKLKKTALKYPIEKAKGRAVKYTEL